MSLSPPSPLGDATPGTSSLTDPFRPTFFELIASSQLRSLLSPAARFTLSVLAQRNPRIFLRTFNSFEELWALCMFFIERHYLTTWGSSFAENFYGLRRRRRKGLSESNSRLPPSKYPDKLTKAQVYACLLFLVGVPYLKNKVHEWWERNGGGIDDEVLFGDEQEANMQSDQSNQGNSGGGGLTFTGEFESESSMESSSRKRLMAKISSMAQVAKTHTLKAYPYATSFWQLWILSYNIRYLFNHTPYWRPYLSFLKLEIKRVGPNDYPSSIPLLPPNLPNPLREPAEFTRRMVSSSPYIFFESLKYALPASLFFFKFLEWWYSSENPRRSRRGGGGDGETGDGSGHGSVGFGAPKPLLPSDKGVLYRRLKGYIQPQLTVSPDEDDDDGGSDDEKQHSRNRPSTSPSLIHNTCPICGSLPIQNPAVLSTGYAFCYTCITAYVEKHNRCPVTRQKIVDGTDGIRRVLA